METPAPSRLAAIGVEVAVLVVEDTPLLRMAAGALLQTICGAPPRFVENGYDAVADVLSAEYDLILMDMQMPVLDGVAAVKLIRLAEVAKKQWRRTPIVAYTSLASVIKRQDLIASGFDDLLAKPATLDEMTACFHRWCRPRSETGIRQAAELKAAIISIGNATSIRAVTALLHSLEHHAATPGQRTQLNHAVDLTKDRIFAADKAAMTHSKKCLAESRATLALASCRVAPPTGR